jgi:hypothetical protein
VLALAFASPFAGCGHEPDRSQTASGQGQDEADSEESADAPVEDKKSARAGRRSGGRGARIGDVPLDAWPEVWFKDPLAVAAEKGSAEAPGTTANPDPGAEIARARLSAAEEGPPAGSSANAAAANPQELNWAAIISGEDLLDETKAIRNSLTQKLQDVGRYSSTYKELRVDATVLTALAGVAIEHPDAPSWKPNAKFIRDVSSEVARGSTANGEKFYRPVRKAYDKLDALFSGSRPPDLEQAADRVKFSEVANRYYLMQRMRKTTDWMKSEINSEAAFKKDGAKLGHEAVILALIAKVIETPDYADADLDEYRGYADAVSQSGLDIGQAAKNGDFAAFTKALDTCNKSCNKCHMEFKDSN